MIQYIKISLNDLQFGNVNSWFATICFATAGLLLILLYSPLADKLANRIYSVQPNLKSFKTLQQSKIRLLIGIVIAWLLGGFLEEIIFRGILLRFIEAAIIKHTVQPLAIAVAIITAGVMAGLIHIYQGIKGMLIVTQLSVLFGLLFVISGYNLWSVILCHGLYDTIAFIRFANKKSKYSQVD